MPLLNEEVIKMYNFLLSPVSSICSIRTITQYKYKHVFVQLHDVQFKHSILFAAARMTINLTLGSFSQMGRTSVTVARTSLT